MGMNHEAPQSDNNDAFESFGDPSLAGLRRMEQGLVQGRVDLVPDFPTAQAVVTVRSSIADRQKTLGITSNLRRLASNDYDHALLVVNTNRASRDSEVYGQELTRKNQEGLPLEPMEEITKNELSDRAVSTAVTLTDYEVMHSLPPYIEPPTDNA
jgi:hypothetical protein